MGEEKARQLVLQGQRLGKKRGRTANQRSSPRVKRKKGRNGEAVDVEEPEPEVETGDVPIFPQPELITGAKLKPYQLEGLQWMVSLDQNGLQWMVSLDQNGISGIRADEMGLEKVCSICLFCLPAQRAPQSQV